MFLKRKCWIFITLFFLKERPINGLSREGSSSSKGKGESSSASRELEKLISKASTSITPAKRGWFDFCSNVFKKDYELAYMGLQFQKEGKFDDAIFCFTRAIDKKPKDPVPYYRLRGDCYREMGKKLDALDDYDRIMKSKNANENRQDRVVFSRLLYDVKRYEDAVKEMKLTENVGEIASLGEDLINKNEYKAAFDCFDEAIRLDATEAEYYRKRAACSIKCNVLTERVREQRIADLRQVVTLEPNAYDQQLLIRALFDAEKYNDAIEEALVSNDFEGLGRLGDLLVSRRKFDEALLFYNAAIEKHPNSGEAKFYQKRGNCYTELEMYDKAIHDFNEMMRKEPNNQKNSAYLKDALLDYGKIDEFVEGPGEDVLVLRGPAESQHTHASNREECAAEQLIQRLKRKAKEHLELPLAYILRINLQAVPERLKKQMSRERRKALSPNPWSFTVLSPLDLEDLGNQFCNNKIYDMAIRCFTEALNKRATASAYRSRSRCHTKMENFAAAISDTCQMWRMEPNNRQYRADLMNALRDYGKIDEVVEESIAVLSTQDLENLGNQFFSEGKLDSALMYFNQVLNRNPSKSAYILRGKCHLEMKNFGEAISDLQKALEMVASTAERTENGMKLLRRALAQIESFDDVPEDTLKLLSTNELHVLASQFQMKNKFEEALHCYSVAITKNPADPYPYKVRANFLAQMNETDKAIHDFLEVAKMSPRDNDNWTTLRKLLYDAERFDELIEYSVNFANVDELMDLCDELYYLQRLEQALRCYTLAIDKNPADVFRYQRRGNFFWATHNVEKALEDFLHVAEKDPTNKENWASLSQVLFETGRFQELINYTLNLSDIDELMSLGDRFSSGGHVDEALRCYNEAINKNPTDLQLYRRRGNFFLGKHDTEKALDDFLYVAERDPRDKVNWASLSQILFESGRFQELIRYTLNLSDVNELMNLGDRFASGGHVDVALHCYTEAINKNPRDPRYYKRRAEGNLRMNNLDEAILDLLQIVDLNPYDEDNWSALSSLLYEHERFDQLIEYTLMLNGLDQLEELCQKLRSAGKIDEAIRCYSYADRESPSDPEFFKRRANFYMEVGKEDIAVFDLLAVSKINPADGENWTRLVRILIDAGKMEELFEYIENVIPELSADQLAELGDKLLTQGEFNMAVHFYTQAILKNPYDSKFYKRRGNGWVQIKDFNEAELDFVQAVELDPEDGESFDSLNEILFQNEKYDELINYTILAPGLDGLAKLGDKFMAVEKFDEALRCYDEGLMKYSEDPAYLHKRGLCHWKMLNIDRAIADFKEALSREWDNVRYRIDLIDALIEVKRLNEAEKVLLMANRVGLTSGDEMSLEEIRQKIITMRFTEFMNYLKKLIDQDATLQMNRIKEDSPIYGFDQESFVRIRDVEFDRDRCTEELTRLELENRTLMLEIRSGRNKSAMEEPPLYLQDPVMLDLMQDPVITPMGITYERESILTNIKNYRRDPISRQEITEDDLRPNLALKDAAALWKEDH